MPMPEVQNYDHFYVHRVYIQAQSVQRYTFCYNWTSSLRLFNMFKKSRRGVGYLYLEENEHTFTNSLLYITLTINKNLKFTGMS